MPRKTKKVIKSNLQRYVEFVVDLINYEEHMQIIEYCHKKYADEKLFKACVAKRSKYVVEFESLPTEEWE